MHKNKKNGTWCQILYTVKQYDINSNEQWKQKEDMKIEKKILNGQ